MLKSLKNILFIVAAASTCVLSSGCDSVIYDDEGDCTPRYRVKFVYDRNMKFADAFDHEVDEVSLYLVDESGKIAWQKHDIATNTTNYTMEVDIVPGKYDMYAWCKGISMTGSSIGECTLANANPLLPSDLCCTIDHKELNDGSTVSDVDLHRIYHGMSLNVDFPDTYGTHDYTLNLTKDTNVVRVMIQQMSGDGLSPDDYIFSIDDDNLQMDQENNIINGMPVTYHEWYKHGGIAEAARAEGDINTVVAELTTGRLMANHNAMLRVNKPDGSLVFKIPLIHYILMVKGKYNVDMSDQEYLDRKDEYNLTFFLDRDHQWINTVIMIESWRVVVNEMQ